MAEVYDLLNGLDAGKIGNLHDGDARKLMLGSVTPDGQTAADFGLPSVDNDVAAVNVRPHEPTESAPNESPEPNMVETPETDDHDYVTGSLASLAVDGATNRKNHTSFDSFW